MPARDNSWMAASRLAGGDVRGSIHLAQVRVERRDRNEHRGGMVPGEFAEMIDVPRDEMVLGDDGDGIAEFRQHCQATPRELELAFDRLIRVGHAAHVDDLRLPSAARRVPGATVPGRPSSP